MDSCTVTFLGEGSITFILPIFESGVPTDLERDFKSSEMLGISSKGLSTEFTSRPSTSSYLLL